MAENLYFDIHMSIFSTILNIEKMEVKEVMEVMSWRLSATLYIKNKVEFDFSMLVNLYFDIHKCILSLK